MEFKVFVVLKDLAELSLKEGFICVFKLFIEEWML